jgi:hypothetical protein
VKDATFSCPPKFKWVTATENIIVEMPSFLLGFCVVTVLALGAISSPAHADSAASEVPVVTPYRPTVSTPAALSAPGWLEIEAGVLSSDGGEPARRDSLPYAFKYALSPDWGIRLQGEALVRDDDPQGQRITGFGDTALILKTRFPVNEHSAFGLEFGVGAATAHPGLHSGSGKTDYSLNGIYSADFASVYHLDLNYTVSRLGVIGPAEGRLQELWATALSRGLGERWGVVGEFSGTHESGVERTAQALVAASFMPAHKISWDLGVARGLTAATPSWSLFAGVTVLSHAF